MLAPATSKRLQWFIAIASLLGLVFQCDILDIFLLGQVILILGWLCAFGAAGLLLLDALISNFRKRPASHMWPALVLAIAVGPAIPFELPAFIWISASHKLLRHRSEYLAAVARADAGEPAPEMYLVEDGPPPYYSFVWGGTTAYWWGIVHDRSETFANAPRDVFHESSHWQIHLWGPWYVAYFS